VPVLFFRLKTINANAPPATTANAVRKTPRVIVCKNEQQVNFQFFVF
jgi:hypothetical protein